MQPSTSPPCHSVLQEVYKRRESKEENPFKKPYFSSPVTLPSSHSTQRFPCSHFIPVNSCSIIRSSHILPTSADSISLSFHCLRSLVFIPSPRVHSHPRLFLPTAAGLVPSIPPQAKDSIGSSVNTRSAAKKASTEVGSSVNRSRHAGCRFPLFTVNSAHTLLCSWGLCIH